MCLFLKGHNENHKLIDINDAESLKDCNLSYKAYIEEFDTVFKKAKDLTKTLEDEILNLNISKEPFIKEINEHFNKQRLKLDEEEKLAKEDFNKRVNKVEDDLKKFLSEVKEVKQSCERIINATNNFENRNEVIKIKTLYYISDINKTNIIAKDLYDEPMKTVKFTTGGILTPVYYTHFYFNGIPVPEDIYISKKDSGKVKISWKIGEIMLNYIDKDKIKYIIEINCDNNKELYESFDTEIVLEDSKSNDDYQVKIRINLENSFGRWSEIAFFRINN